MAELNERSEREIIFTNKDLADIEDLVGNELVIDIRKPFVVCVTEIPRNAEDVETYFIDLSTLDTQKEKQLLLLKYITTALSREENAYGPRIEKLLKNLDRHTPSFPCLVQGAVNFYVE